MTFSQKALWVALMAAVLGFVFWTVPAAAAAAAQDKVCADDAKRLCSDVQAGRGNVMKCLKAHEADLSAACKDRIQVAQGTIQACQSDAAKFCADVPPGRGSVASCLKQHQSELSAECKAGLSQAKTRRTPQQ
jgi:hypothetical protein